MLQPTKPEPGAHKLALGALAAIDEETSRPTADEQRRRASLGGGYCRGGAEKDDFKHAALPKMPGDLNRASQVFDRWPFRQLGPAITDEVLGIFRGLLDCAVLPDGQGPTRV